MSLKTRQLGRDGPVVSAIGLGMGSLGGFYGPTGTLDEKIAILDHAHKVGIRFWDAADVYGDAEDIIGEWVKRNPEKRKDIVIATKFALKMKPGGGQTFDSSPEHVREACHKSHKRLHVECIDVYYCHRVDGVTPIEKTVEAMAELKKEGKIKHLGLSECSPTTLRRAVAIHPIAAMEMEYSLFCLDIEENETLKTCRELGIAITAYSPIGRGILTGTLRSQSDLPENDLRRFLPKYSEQNFTAINKMIYVMDKIRDERYGPDIPSLAQIALAWLLAQGDDIVPIPGTKRMERIDENLKAADFLLHEREVMQLREAAESVDIVGTRYPEAVMATLCQDTPPL